MPTCPKGEKRPAEAAARRAEALSTCSLKDSQAR